MPDYYSIQDIQNRRDTQLGNLARMKAEQVANERVWADYSQNQQQQEQLAQATNPHSLALQGMALGAGFGPVGAGVGAAIGGGLGFLRDIAGRRKAGQSWGDTIGGALIDPLRLDKLAGTLTTPGGAQAASSIAQNMARQKDIEARRRALSDLQAGSMPTSGLQLKKPEDLKFGQSDSNFHFNY